MVRGDAVGWGSWEICALWWCQVSWWKSVFGFIYFVYLFCFILFFICLFICLFILVFFYFFILVFLFIYYYPFYFSFLFFFFNCDTWWKSVFFLIFLFIFFSTIELSCVNFKFSITIFRFFQPKQFDMKKNWYFLRYFLVNFCSIFFTL